jgi:hypothetical protein
VRANDTAAHYQLVNGSQLPLQQNFLLPFEWAATYWPRKTGWQYAFTRDHTPFSWYTYRDNEWNDIRVLKQMAINKRYASNITIAMDRLNNSDKGITESNKRILLIIMFMLCCTYLWIEEKLYRLS